MGWQRKMWTPMRKSTTFSPREIAIVQSLPLIWMPPLPEHIQFSSFFFRPVKYREVHLLKITPYNSKSVLMYHLKAKKSQCRWSNDDKVVSNCTSWLGWIRTSRLNRRNWRPLERNVWAKFSSVRHHLLLKLVLVLWQNIKSIYGNKLFVRGSSN